MCLKASMEIWVKILWVFAPRKFGMAKASIIWRVLVNFKLWRYRQAVNGFIICQPFSFDAKVLVNIDLLTTKFICLIFTHSSLTLR